MPWLHVTVMNEIEEIVKLGLGSRIKGTETGIKEAER
jgi:hypothetical protein